MFEDVTDAGLVDLIAAQERAVSRACAEQARVIGALLARRSGSPEFEFVVDELRMELHLTGPAADAKLGLAQLLVERPAVWQVLYAGAIDVGRARVVLELLAACPEPLRSDIEALALEYAEQHTSGQVRVFIERRLIKADPAAANARRRQAVHERKVSYTALPDGMGMLTAVLPAETARAIYDQLTLLTRTASHTGDDRSSDQRRADGLTALCLGNFHTLNIPAPAWLTSWLDTAGRAGGRRLPAGVDSIGRRVEIGVLVPLDTLLGAGGEPARLTGHGPIPPDLLHQLAYTAGATWRRILTDPTSGQVLAVDAHTYRPPVEIARFVQVRSGTCTAPGCRQPAAWADLDHRIPYPRGSTSRANLQPLCRHHHRMKHTGRWRVYTHLDGSTTWTTPAGKSYRAVPEPIPAVITHPVLDPVDAHPHDQPLRLIKN